MPAVRRTQRSVLSCTECARRKTRCSKTVPCSSCIDRGVAQACHRETVSVVSRAGSRSSGSIDRRHDTVAQLTPKSNTRETSTGRSPNASVIQNHANLEDLVKSSGSGNEPERKPDILDNVPTNETVATLEFLAYGRQNILNLHNPESASPSHGTTSSNLDAIDERPIPSWDMILSPREARALLNFHQEKIAWMHNVLHMPTLMEEFEVNIRQETVDGSWLALYYAVLCTTFHHCSEDGLMSLGIDVTECDYSAHALYDKSIQHLFSANFMAKHTLHSVQAICILMQVAHNIDQSDFICVLIATGIRIAQCLNMHRLGPDRPNSNLQAQSQEATVRALVDREVKKRVWWFLVRQDWLQIPFQNTYLIHATQFNTPLPLNCFDELELMISDGVVVAQPDEVYTQNSYSHGLSKAAVIIWQQQDRMCSVGHPGNNPDGLQRIYDQALWADKELHQVYAGMPSFLKIPESSSKAPDNVPPYARLLASAALLSTAHKACITLSAILTVHRHFQLQSFQDRRFAYTQLSCISIAARCLRDIKTWPNDQMTSIVKRMWTVPTHLVTCCIILTFASIFRHENELLYDAVELHHLAQYGRDVIRQLEDSSSIARRGGILLDILSEPENSERGVKKGQLDLGDIVRRVSLPDHTHTHARLSEAESLVLQLGNDTWDSVFGASDFDVMDTLRDIAV